MLGWQMAPEPTPTQLKAAVDALAIALLVGCLHVALVLELEIRSVKHVSCPLTRADKVAGGATLPAPRCAAS